MRVADTDPEEFDLARLPKHVLNAVEADSFWCLSRLLDGIQDNYIHQQPGIHRSVRRMAELVARIDGMVSSAIIVEVECAYTGTRSAVGSTSGGAERGVHAIRLPVDELPAHAGNQREEYHPHVGHLPRTSPSCFRRLRIAETGA